MKYSIVKKEALNSNINSMSSTNNNKSPKNNFSGTQGLLTGMNSTINNNNNSNLL